MWYPKNVKFLAESGFDVIDNYDIIWSRQSISHIEPVDKFIEFAYSRLKGGGKLIINDSNMLNPYLYYMQRKRIQRTRGRIYATRKNPRTGEDVPYARERMLTVLSIQKMLLKKGFLVEAIVEGFCPYISRFDYRSKNISYYLNNIFKRLPIIRMFGSTHTIVGRKI
ncbi:hypothetical protein ACFLW8_04305 [Chloroflexota bacterium]